MGPAHRNMGELAPEILPSAEGRTRPDVGRWEVPPPGLRPPPRTAEFRDARPHITVCRAHFYVPPATHLHNMTTEQ